MSRRKKYRIFLWALLVSGLTGLGVLSVQELKEEIPDAVKVRGLEDLALDFGWLVTETVTPEAENVSVNSFASREYQVECKLLGVVPLKTVDVELVEPEMVYIGGNPVGIYLETQGILIIGTGVIKGTDGLNYEPAKYVVQPGDYILAVNQQEVTDKEELVSLISQEGAEEIVLTLRRDQDVIEVGLETVETQEGYKAGIWVRDNTQGIGTLTFLTLDQEFGALGHGINDVDTGELLEIGEGNLYETKILNIRKGESGNPGEISGTILYREECEYGSILQNTSVGIFGSDPTEKLLQECSGQLVETALKQEVKEGKAVIRSAVSGSLEDYEVEITDVQYSEKNVNKGIVLQVTDERLLQLTGGIVQGMSGSPILQDGKLIGAVTHVFVQDSTKGFGIFIENMLDQVD